MYAEAVFHEQPDWSRQPGRRLALNLLPSTLIVVAALAVLRWPVAEQSLPLTELVVRILVAEADEILPAPEEELPEELSAEPSPVVQGVDAAPVEEPAIEDSRPATDWYALIPEAANAVVTERPREYSINPLMDEKRRHAAEKFRPSRAPVKRPVWENVERDTMGRTLLRSGDCFRVIDDPNVGNRDAFMTFGQFLITCGRSSGRPQMLPWVDEIKNRRVGQARYGHPAVE